MSRARPTALLALAALGLISACSQPGSATKVPPQRWVDQPVTFQAGGLTIYATYRHPAAATATGQPKTPAVLLIAGSGSTDRNGNSAELAGPVDTLQTLADWLSADGVASLRYDKLGSGQTGRGRYASHPATIGLTPFEQEAAAALEYLARQPGVDPARLGVIGHSEGALFALLLATGASPQATGTNLPAIHALGLLEPLSERYLDVLRIQIATLAPSLTPAFTAAVTQLRATGTVPEGLPAELSAILNPDTALFLHQADRYDPAQLAEHLTPQLPVLVTCSNADRNVTCGEVDHLVAGLTKTRADTDFVHLTGVDHVLKQDPTGAPADDTKPLPFSPQLRQALRAFVAEHL